jgi:hypothetical protein
MMTPAAPSMDTVTEPPLHPRPAHGDHDHNDRKRDHSTADIDDVAKGVVSRGIRRLRQLNGRYSHHGSKCDSTRSCLSELLASMSRKLRTGNEHIVIGVVIWLTRCGATSTIIR